MRIAIVASDFNKEVTSGLIDGALKCYKSNFGNTWNESSLLDGTVFSFLLCQPSGTKHLC